MTAKSSERVGPRDRCHACGATSGAAADSDGYACVLCGAPRIVVDPPVTRPGAEKPLLERAKALRTERAGWGLAAGFSTAGAVAAVAGGALLSLFVDFGPTSGALFATLVAAPSLLALFGFWNVRRKSSAIRQAMGEAQQTVAGEVVNARGGSMEAGELAEALGISRIHAEELLALTQVDRFLEGEDPAPRLRVRLPEDAAGTGEAQPEEPAVVRRDRVR